VGNFFEELRRRNVVRVAGVYAVVAWVLIQIATALEESMNLPSWFDGLIVALLLIGLPVALLFAWAFELTPDGVVRTENVLSGESITGDTGRKLDYAIIGGILVLGAIMLWQGNRVPDQIEDLAQPDAGEIAATGSLTEELEDTFAPPEKSIAVLPFENRSPNPDDVFFADGMHDDLLTHLSKIRDMHVISRTSVMGYADTDLKIPEIARDLGVATVMEGAVQRAGNRVRINVQLIDAVTDAHLWAEIYDRELTADNIFDIQSEITKAIATALNSVLSSADKEQLDTRPTESVEAYDAYMAGRLKSNVFYSQRKRFDEAIASFDLAISYDPDFAEAYAGKAYTQVAAYWYAIGDEPWLEWALESLQQAEALAPDSVETLTARGYYYYWGLLDYDTANTAFERALDQSPNNILTLAGYAYSNRRAGNFEVALAALEQGHRLDPMSHDVVLSLADTYVKLGHFGEARSAYRRAEAIRFGEVIDPTQGIDVFLGMGDTDRAWDVIVNPTTELSPDVYYYRFNVALATRDPEKIEYALESWPEDMRRPADSYGAYDLAKGRALRFLGKEGEAHKLLTELQARLNASENPYPQGWKANAIYWPVELPGLLGDLDGVRAVIREHEAESLPDAWGRTDKLKSFAAALAAAGDPDAAFDYIGRLISEYGPFQFASLSVAVEFDALHDDVRWLAHKADYEVWLARN
jgi:TolB-like protein